MEFKTPLSIINEELISFAAKILKRDRVWVPKLSKAGLSQLANVAQEIQKNGLPQHFVLKKLKGKLGSGIFLHPKASPIERGTVIGVYAGEVYLAPQNGDDNSDYAFALLSDLRLTKEEQRQFDPKRRYHPRRLYSLDLDADKRGNFTRFINHSEKPNVEAQFLKIPVNRLGLEPSPFEIVYVAKKTIHPGEQLLVCYDGDDKSYWGALGIKPFPMTPRTFKLNSSLEFA